MTDNYGSRSSTLIDANNNVIITTEDGKTVLINLSEYLRKQDFDSAFTKIKNDHNKDINDIKIKLKDFISREKYQHDMDKLKKSINDHLMGDDKHDEHIKVLIDKKLSENDSNKKAKIAIWVAGISAVSAVISAIVTCIALFI